MPGTTHDFLYPTNRLEDDSGNNYECTYIRGAFTRRAAQADNIIYAQSHIRVRRIEVFGIVNTFRRIHDQPCRY